LSIPKTVITIDTYLCMLYTLSVNVRARSGELRDWNGGRPIGAGARAYRRGIE
jgi:hypothetical protein